MDYVVLNTAPISGALKRKYAEQHVEPVDNDFERLNALGVKILAGDLVGDSKLVRHEPRATARIIVALATRSREDRLRKAKVRPISRRA
jgi:hypothetical protein